jgi:hypothetical protein
VDLGQDDINVEEEEATEAYVFMATCIEEQWKLPIACFLINR